MRDQREFLPTNALPLFVERACDYLIAHAHMVRSDAASQTHTHACTF